MLSGLLPAGGVRGDAEIIRSPLKEEGLQRRFYEVLIRVWKFWKRSNDAVREAGIESVRRLRSASLSRVYDAVLCGSLVPVLRR